MSQVGRAGRRSHWQALSGQAIFAGVLAAFVGFASTFSVILAGLRAVGATPGQAASGLFALSVAMGLCGIWLSFRRREPISVAWTTPGAALLIGAGVPEGGFPTAVGAFIAMGAMIVLAGLIRPLARAVASIPRPIASAMMGGILLSLCLAPVRAVAEAPSVALPVVIVWALVGRLKRLYAVPAAVAVAAVLVAVTAPPSAQFSAASILPDPLLVWPTFTARGLVGLALPLFVVTMASQNIPGLAVLGANGYRPAPGGIFVATGIATIASAPFGAPGINLAAITAAICAGPEAHSDPARRYWAGAVSGCLYVALGLLAGLAAALVAASPPILIEAVAGLALLGAFGNAIEAALERPATREAAVITFVVTASGISVLGVGGAFWGLIAGLAMLALSRWRA